MLIWSFPNVMMCHCYVLFLPGQGNVHDANLCQISVYVRFCDLRVISFFIFYSLFTADRVWVNLKRFSYLIITNIITRKIFLWLYFISYKIKNIFEKKRFIGYYKWGTCLQQRSSSHGQLLAKCCSPDWLIYLRYYCHLLNGG